VYGIFLSTLVLSYYPIHTYSIFPTLGEKSFQRETKRERERKERKERKKRKERGGRFPYV
jgi:hypothetical protein